MTQLTTADVSAIVCTMNSISGIQKCLDSLREANVGQLIVVDAHSTDGTAEIAQEKADRVIQDPGLGLGAARNMGIALTSATLILNMGSDNVMPPGELEKMIRYLQVGNYQGVSAQTRVMGNGQVANGLNVWRSGRFPAGERAVIGTPTLFVVTSFEAILTTQRGAFRTTLNFANGGATNSKQRLRSLMLCVWRWGKPPGVKFRSAQKCMGYLTMKFLKMEPCTVGGSAAN